MNPWDGYFLKTNQDNLTLKIPAPAALPDTPPTPDYLKPPMAPPVAQNSILAVTQDSTLEGQFNLTLSLTSDFASDLTTTLGAHQNAQVGRDAFDQSEPPTLSKTVAVYFDHSDWEESGRYNRDIQTALKVGEQRTWKFTVYTDNQDAEMKLSWEKAIVQLPDDIMLYFRFVVSHEAERSGVSDGTPLCSVPNYEQWQDMREVQSVDLASHSRITKIPFEVKAERFEMSPISDLQVIAGEKQVAITWRVDGNNFISAYTIAKRLEKDGRMEGWKETTLRLESLPIIQSSDEARRQRRGFAYSSAYGNHPVFQFIDTDVAEEATYTYQVTVHFISGVSLKSELFTVTVLPVIKKNMLLQSYPNPFNPDVWIPYELEKESTVSIEIYNAAGQLVHTSHLGTQPRGRYINKEKAAYWDGKNRLGELAVSGLYFYVLKAGNFTATRKMVIVK